MLALAVWIAPALPAWAAPGNPQAVDLNNYQGPARAEVLELQRFVLPIMNEAASLSLDMIAVAMADNPDMQIQVYEQMQMLANTDTTTSAEVKNKLRMLLNNAKTQRQLGRTVDEATHMRQMNTLMPSYLARLRQINEKLYNGIRPRLFKIADKDPDYALQICYAMMQRINASQLQAKANSAGATESDRKMLRLPAELQQYAVKVKAKQGQ